MDTLPGLSAAGAGDQAVESMSASRAFKVANLSIS
eukprot:CAMPEP_0171519998 /NCGR_PEP_ID=MMETSP0959-20130129/6236_1 /TAXON_ID=87120 /ORGANISM="Aurantiochytrium limacinum, Strain ATCCMYA-1381" /LENGTH=34 /DNA_ID= /DNA_START= /DNA_END= /DNA_ORIENTATION=